MVHSDTSAAAAQVQTEVWRRLGPDGRIGLMLEMCEAAAETSKAGIRQRHPDYSEAQVQDAFLVLLWGRELFTKAFPARTLSRP